MWYEISNEKKERRDSPYSAKHKNKIVLKNGIMLLRNLLQIN